MNVTNTTKNCDFDSDVQCDTIYGLRIGFGTLSLFGCFFILVSIALGRTYRNFAQRLIMHLTIAALFSTVPYFMGSQDDGPTCILQGFLMQWQDASVLLWIGCLTHSLYLNVVRLEESVKNEKWYMAISWVLPFGVACIPLIANKYGNAGLWCWIVNDSWMRFGLWYGWLVFGVIGLFASNIYIFHRVSNKNRQWQGTYNQDVEAEKEFLQKQVKPLIYYPIVYLLLSIFPLINRVQNAANPDTPVFWLYVLHTISSPLQGFCNVLVYISNQESNFWHQWTVSNVKRALGTRRASVHEFDISNDELEDHMVPNDEDSTA
eukprot:m.214217 g.214217  ORF g.214217 m.214217 type:complete len:319 (+) comp15865_c0_seq65:382-1338(+)